MSEGPLSDVDRQRLAALDRRNKLAEKLYEILSREDNDVFGLSAKLEHEYLPNEIELVLDEYRIVDGKPVHIGEGQGGGWRE